MAFWKNPSSAGSSFFSYVFPKFFSLSLKKVLIFFKFPVGISPLNLFFRVEGLFSKPQINKQEGKYENEKQRKELTKGKKSIKSEKKYIAITNCIVNVINHYDSRKIFC